MIIRLQRCESFEDVVSIYNSYKGFSGLCHELTVDVTGLDSGTNFGLVVGLLLNIKGHFDSGTTIKLKNASPALCRFLSICKLEQCFVPADSCAARPTDSCADRSVDSCTDGSADSCTDRSTDSCVV